MATDGASAAAKRQRLETFDAEEFAPGAIQRITLHNFMSYSDAELVNPGPRLNCILGPNGTGKSSLVCALALGLGGNNQITERGSRPSDSVKEGCTDGWIEIELRDADGPGKNLVVKTVIYAASHTGGKTVTYINGEKKTKDELRKRMAKLNIQIDNMLQFLPQDKVASFTGLNPRELLLSTLRATLPERHAQFEELRVVDDKVKELKGGDATRTSELEKLRSKNEKLQTDVDRLKTFKDHEARKRDLIGKGKWLAVKEKQAFSDQLKAKAKEVKEEAKKAQRAMEAAEAPVKALEAAQAAAKRALTEAEKACKEAEDRRVALHRAVDSDLEAEIRKAQEDVTAALEDKANRAAELRKLEVEVDKAKARVGALPDAEAGAAKVRQLKAALTENDTALVEADTSLAACKMAADRAKRKTQVVRNHCSSLDSTSAQKELVMRRDAKQSMELKDWITENSSLFEGRVFGPIALEIDPVDVQAASFVEVQVGANVLRGFLTTSSADKEKITRRIREEKLNVACYGVDPGAPRPKHQFDARADPALAAAGVQGWLDELVKGPLEVLSFLCRYNGLANALVGSKETAAAANVERVTEILKGKGLNSFILYTPAQRFQASQSRYGDRKTLTDSRNVGPPGAVFQQAAVDPGDRARAEASVKEYEAAEEDAVKAMEEAKALHAKAGAAVQALRTEIAREARALQDLRGARAGLQKAEKKLEEARAAARADKDEATRQAAVNRLQRAHEKRVAKFGELVKACEAVAAAEPARHAAAISGAAAEARMAAAKATYQLAVAEFNDLQKAWDRANRERETARADMTRLAKEANDFHPEFALRKEGVSRPADVEARWADLPEEPAAIEDEVKDVEAKLASMTHDKDAMNNFEANAARIKTLEAEQGGARARIAELEENAQRIRTEWAPAVRDMAKRVSDKFAEYFASFKCAGEVRLNESDNFEDYALEIKVRWRAEEELHVLGDKQDSGGERSVATMVYLIALQDVNPCPFRVVDEINQAMDPDNERLIFECITHATADQQTKTQYFLITPKLLPDLHYSETTTLHFVYNGPFMQPSHKFTLSDVLAQQDVDNVRRSATAA